MIVDAVAVDPGVVQRMLRLRGVDFVESPAGVHSEARGAVTRPVLGGVTFELVHDEAAGPQGTNAKGRP